ncbi:MAG TPA: hypothetical protein VGR67_08405 [Candidatus Polarisedimenticolia bacterium]|jgi:hypothetical protein|nr:hypothetical protein [Candidatus Polarisedimenticolia bacterium]
MITGFNTDVEYNGRIYHIQTEDKGASNPVIESLIYVGGEILASHRTPYSDLLRDGTDASRIAEKLESQHHRMIMNVRQGRLDPEGVKPFGAGIISDRGFEEVVLEYLGSELATEALQVVLESPADFTEGKAHEVVVRARGELSSMPVKGTRVVLRMITTLDKPSVLAEGATDEKGILRMDVTVPRMEEGNAALVLQALRDGELVELKFLVRKPGSDSR